MEELMTIQEVAAYLKMSQQTIYRMARQGKIPALKVRNRWRFRRNDIESWLTLENNSSRGQILIVNDDPAIADSFARALESENCRLVSAPTGQMAIQKVKQQSFDLIYLDLDLPDISGLETLKAIRQIDDTIKVVVITGCEGDLLREILELGPFTILMKPFGADEISETVRMHV